MAKVPGVPTREFRAALKANNFRLQRSNGGHEIWEKTITIHCSFPNHGKEINGALAQRLNNGIGFTKTKPELLDSMLQKVGVKVNEMDRAFTERRLCIITK